MGENMSRPRSPKKPSAASRTLQLLPEEQINSTFRLVPYEAPKKARKPTQPELFPDTSTILFRWET